MVLIIKATDDVSSDMRKVASQMVNMESNQHVYRDDGSPKYPDEKDTKRSKFNVYQHHSVEFSFDLSFGVILIYSKYEDVVYQTMISDEIKKLGVPSNLSNFININSDYYTLAKSEVTSRDTASQHHNSHKKCFRKIISDPYYLKRSMSGSKTKFVWLIVKKVERNFRGSYLKIQELDPSIPSEVYLNKSVCTIIYDGLNLFNVPTMTKQLDYPSIEQYNFYKENQILKDPIYLSWTGGLRYEMYYQFTGKSPLYLHIDPPEDGGGGNDYSLFKPIETIVDSNTVELKRLNPEKDWRKQLQEPFDYKKQEEDEIKLVDEGKPKFPNDICFISRMPLWDQFYMIRIKNETSEFDIAVAPSVVHQRYPFKKTFSNIRHVIEHIDKVKFVGLRICHHSRSFLEVLDMIDVHPVKKNIMRCIEMHGCYSKSNDSGNHAESYSRHARKYYTTDKSKGQIYIGLTGINDSHIVLYHHTKTILFRVIEVESQAGRPPDVHLFPDQHDE